MPRHRPPISSRLLAKALPALLAVVALAQPEFKQTEDPQVRIDGLIAQLDAATFAERQAAASSLRRDLEFDLRACERALARTDLSAEQRFRLEGLGYDLFERGPRAGLGVTFGAEVAFGVQIQNAVQQQGFAADRHIKPGDIVVSAGGMFVRTQDELRLAIISRDPGDVLPLTIRRDADTVEESVPLGAFSDLNNGGLTLPSEILHRAWQLRLARMGHPQPPRPVLDARHGFTTPARPPEVELEPWSVALLPFAAGGAPRGGVDQSGRVRIRVAGYDLSLPPIPAAAEAIRNGDARSSVSLLNAELQTQRETVSRKAREARLITNDPSRPADERRAAAERLAELSELQRRIEDRMKELWDLYDAPLGP